MKRSAVTVFAALFIFCFAQALQAASRTVTVYIGTRELKLLRETIFEDGKVLVSVNILAQLDADYVTNPRRVTIAAGEHPISLDVLSRGGKTMLHLDEVAKALDLECKWDDATSKATLCGRLLSVELKDGTLTAKTTLPTTASNVRVWPDPWRLSIDLPGTRMATPNRTITVEDKDVSQIRLGQFDEQTARIVVDLSSKVPFKVLTVGPSREQKLAFRLASMSDKPVADGPVQRPSTEEKTQAVSVTGVRSEPDGDSALKLCIATTGKAKFTSSLFADPLRLVVDVQNSRLEMPLADIPVEHELVDDVRVSQDGSTSRIILDMPRYSVFNIKSGSEGIAVSLKMPVAAGGRLSDKRVVIDPGHGGKDRGAACGKTNEKSLALKFAYAIKSGLEKEGATVILTRYGDTYLTLPDRPAVADQHTADFFISIHCNSTRAAAIPRGGMETYYHPGQPSSKILAEAIHSRNIAETDMADRHSKLDTGGKADRVGWSVLRNAQVPAILIETGFLNCETDRDQLCSDEFPDKLARGILAGLRDYVEGTSSPEEE